MVSNGGGEQPVWRGDGRELFYFGPKGIVSVETTTEGNFSFGPPRALFSVSVKGSVSSAYTVSNDGQFFLTNELPPSDPSKVGARLIQNWTALLSR